MDHSIPFRSGNRRWLLWILIALLCVIILAIAIPLAVILPKKGSSTSHILLPLYVYPENSSSWQPLYDTLDARPELRYIIIINPKSGPGGGAPDKQYAVQMVRLSSYPNVQKVGYVRTGYASRNISDVLAEVDLYAQWGSISDNYTMHGIFFDESPHVYSADAVGFMRTATEAVKKTKGLGEPKTVIRNPGVVPDPAYNDTNTDISVVFEQSYSQYQTLESGLKDDLHEDRSAYCYMVHSVPSLSLGDLKKFVDSLSKKAAYLFVTNNDANYYESFGSDWSDFTKAMPKA